MDISKMTDQEKSMLLAKAMGWNYFIGQHDKMLHIESTELLPQNGELYNPANMALAWRVLNWASKNKQLNWLDGFRFKSLQWRCLATVPPDQAQRFWLDKILCLCLETGIIKENNELD